MPGTVATDFAFFVGASTTSNCDNATGWSGSPTPDSEVFVEGAGALSAKISKSTYTSVYTLGAPANLSDQIVTVWMNMAQPSGLPVRASGGLRIRVQDASANWAEWYVGGSDNYYGGWESFAIRTNQSTYRTTSATPPNYAAITAVGVVCQCTASAAKVNFWWDALRFGTYMQIYAGTSGSPATWDNLVADDTTNAYGLILRREGILLVQSKIYIGSTGAGVDTYFADSGEVVVFRDRPFGTDYYEIKGQGNSTGTTEIYFGTKAGSAGVSGGVIKSVGDSKLTIDMDDQYITKLGLYGASLYDVGTIYLPTTSADREVLNCNFESCYEVQVSTCKVEYCNFISPYDAGGSSGAVLISDTSHGVKYCSFIGCADGWHVDTIGTYACTGDKFINCTYDIGNSSAGLVTINAANLANPSTYENTGGGSTSIKSSVYLDVHVENAAGAALENVQCYIEKATPTEYTSDAAANVQGDVTFVVQEDITNDTPSAGWLRVWTATNTEQLYRVASWTSKTFTFETKVGPYACSGGGTATLLQDSVRDFTALDIMVGDTVRNETDGSWAIVLVITDAHNITTSPLQNGVANTWTAADEWSVHSLALTYDGNDKAYTPYMNEETDAAGDAQAVTNYTTDTAIRVKARKYGYKTFKGSGTVESDGFSVSIILAVEPNVNL